MLAVMVMSLILNMQPSDSLMVPFPCIPGNYINDSTNLVEIRKYDLSKRVDTLYYHGKVIIQPDSPKYENIYEMFKEQYIIAIPTTEETWYINTIYELPKYRIQIIALSDLDKIYEVNIEGKDLVGIDLAKGVVYVKDPETGESKEIKVERIVEDDASPVLYLYVDEMPQFGEGGDSLYSYLNEHVKWTGSLDITGRVVVAFVVSKLGEVKDIVVEKAPCSVCAEEITKVLGSMPKWKPGIKDGRAVDVKLFLEYEYRVE